MSSTQKTLIKLCVVLLLSGSALFLPDLLNTDEKTLINPIQARVVALFIFAALMWILEVIPIWTTSVAVIAIALFTTSNQSLNCFKVKRFNEDKIKGIIADAYLVSPDMVSKAYLASDTLQSANNERQALKAQASDIVMKAITSKAPLTREELVTVKTELEAVNSRITQLNSCIDNLTNARSAVLAADKALLTCSDVEKIQKEVLAELVKQNNGTPVIGENLIIDDQNNALATLKSGMQKVQSTVITELGKTSQLSSSVVRSKIEAAILAPVLANKVTDDQKVAYTSSAAKLYDMQADQPGARINNPDLELISETKQKSIFATLADPIILLFLGGFFLADAATKYRLDINLARVLLKPFGTNPKYVLLGLMSVTALFSMFMSNTATAAMMLALLTPVLALFKAEDRGRAAFALCIPIGANVGGIGTPIGTPPNAIALKAMQDIPGLDISFGKWMAFGIPFVLIMLVVSWFLLLKMFPISQKSLDLSKELQGKFLKTPKAIIVYITFVVTILMWVIPKEYHGLDSNSVAIIPIAVFSITGVITKKDLNAMSWDVLWLVAGGFALGVALSETNLANDLIKAIPFNEWDQTILLIAASCICLFMATFMSHTATAALLVPILAVVAKTMPLGGAAALLVTVAFASSLGMALPISTPPNAMAYATGHIEQKGMAISGTILCLLGLAITILMMVLLGAIGFFG